MTFNRYTSYPTFPRGDATKGTIAAAIKNGRYEELVISADGSTASWVVDRVLFQPQTKTYGGAYPFVNNQFLEYGSIFCRYQDDFDSIGGRQRTFAPSTAEGGSVSLSKIAPLYDQCSLYLRAVDDVAGATAGLTYNSRTPNDWDGISGRDVSIDFYVKPHGTAVDGATLSAVFGANHFGVSVTRASGAWNVVLHRNGATTSTAITLPMERWSHIALNKTKASGGSSTYTIYLDGTSVYSTSAGELDSTVYTAFKLYASGITNSGTSFFVSNLRVDTNALRKTIAPSLLDDNQFINAGDPTFYFPHGNAEVDPFYDQVTCLLRSDYEVSNHYDSFETEAPMYDVTGYNRVSVVPNYTPISVIKRSDRYSLQPGQQITRWATAQSSLVGTFTHMHSGVSSEGHPGDQTYLADGTYCPYLIIKERDRESLTFASDFTFELWAFHTKPGAYTFSTGGSIALVDGQLTGLGSTITLGGYGVTTGLNEWAHIAISRAGSTVRVFINQNLVGTSTYSGVANFNDLILFGSNADPGVSDKFMRGVIGQVRATKACRYTSATDVIDQIYNAYTRVEHPLYSNMIYDPKTDYVFGAILWAVYGTELENANTDLVRLTLFKFDQRSRTIVLQRDIWSKGNDDSLTCRFGYTNFAHMRFLFTLVDNYIVIPRELYEYVLFDKNDLTEKGVYSTRKDEQRQHRMLIEAGPDQYVTWTPTTVPAITAVSDPAAGYLVTALHFGVQHPYHNLKDPMNNVVTFSGSMTDNADLTPYTAAFKSDRTGVITIASNPDFAFKSDFTIEFECKFLEVNHGNITSCTLYSQNGITIAANNLTLTATVFGDTLQFVGTSSGQTATFGAIQASSHTFYNKIFHIALTRTDGEVRLFLNGVMAQKVTNTTQGTASNIVIGQNLYGFFDELMVYNGYSKYSSDATFTPSRYTSTAQPSIGMTVTHRGPTNSTYQTADGIYPAVQNTFMSARKSRVTSTNTVVFAPENTSPVHGYSGTQTVVDETVLYHPTTNSIWSFANQEPLNGTGNVGYIWNIDGNTVTPIPKQGNMLRVIASSGAFAYKFNTVSATNPTPDFGSVINYGLTIDQSESYGSYDGSLVMNKTAGQYARIPNVPISGFFFTASSTFTSGNWTIELRYFNPVLQAEATPDVLLSDQYSHTPRFEIGVQRTATDCKTFFRVYNDLQTITLTSLGAPQEDIGAGTWAHIALVRSGTSILGYTNGVLTHSYTLVSSVNMLGTFANCWIGCSSAQTNFARGRIQEISISNGLARYTGATYTVPTSPFFNRASSSTENIIPLSIYLHGDDVILCGRLGTNFNGAWRFNSAGTLIATYGFGGFEDNTVSAFNGLVNSMWFAPRYDIDGNDDLENIETHALYGYGDGQQPCIYMWDLDTPSSAPSRRIRYIPDPLTNPFPSSVGNGSPLAQSSAWLLYGSSGAGFSFGTQPQEFLRNVPPRPAAPARRVVGLNFEGIVSGSPIPAEDTYADVTIGTYYNADYSLTFDSNAVATRSYLYGGFGRFGVRDSVAARGGEAAMKLTGTECIISSSHPNGFTIGLSFWHASSSAFTVNLYASDNGTGAPIISTPVTPTGTCSLPDVNNIYCSWDMVSIVAGTAFKSVKIIGTANTVFIDNLTFGSLTPTDEGLVNINGSNVNPTYNTALPTVETTLTVPADKSGVISSDITMPVTPVTQNDGIPFMTNAPFSSDVQWHKVPHDGTRTLKVTVMQPSDLTYSNRQGHNANRYLHINLYDDEGNAIQRLYSQQFMLSYIGLQKAASESSITKPYALPMVIPKGFPTGDYYIGVTHKRPGDLRFWNQTVPFEPKFASMLDYGYAGTSGAPDAGTFVLASTPVISVNCDALPLVDAISNYPITIQGDVAGTSSIETTTPINGLGSLKFDLAAVSPSQEIVVTDAQWSDVFLLTKMNNSAADVTGNNVVLDEPTFTQQKQNRRFGLAAASGNAQWQYTYADFPLPDQNGFCIETFITPTNDYVNGSKLEFIFGNGEFFSTRSLTLRIFTDPTFGRKYKLRAICVDTVVFGGTVFDQTSTAFEMPSNWKWQHLAIVKEDPVANVSVVKVCVNGEVVGSISLNVATGYMTDTHYLNLNNTFGVINELRITASPRYVTPFQAPHYSFPTS